VAQLALDRWRIGELSLQKPRLAYPAYANWDFIHLWAGEMIRPHLPMLYNKKPVLKLKKPVRFDGKDVPQTYTGQKRKLKT
jgi:hypothetical protein